MRHSVAQQSVREYLVKSLPYANPAGSLPASYARTHQPVHAEWFCGLATKSRLRFNSFASK